MPGSFIDTNVLIYLASEDRRKAERAESLVHAPGGIVSVQVLNEIANVARRKMGLSWPETCAFLDPIKSLLDVRPIRLEDHQIGLALAERYRLSVYDSMIVASALQADCERLWSEAMQDGLVIEDRLQIANPFNAEV